MTEADYQLIENYQLGNLTEEEVSAFEERIKVDKEFAEAVSVQKSMDHLLQFKSQKKKLDPILNQLGEVHFTASDNPTNLTSIKQKKSILPLIAAILLLVISASIWILAPKEQNLYQEFAQHETIQLTQRGNTIDRKIQQAEAAFNQKEYAVAYPLFSKLSIQEPTNIHFQLLKGICALELNQLEEAKSIFTKIQQGDSAFKEEGSWYLAMSFLKEENEKEAKKILEKASLNSFYLKEKAKKIINKI